VHLEPIASGIISTLAKAGFFSWLVFSRFNVSLKIILFIKKAAPFPGQLFYDVERQFIGRS
jgi:hypothetical protein